MNKQHLARIYKETQIFRTFNVTIKDETKFYEDSFKLLYINFFEQQQLVSTVRQRILERAPEWVEKYKIAHSYTNSDMTLDVILSAYFIEYLKKKYLSSSKIGVLPILCFIGLAFSWKYTIEGGDYWEQVTITCRRAIGPISSVNDILRAAFKMR